MRTRDVGIVVRHEGVSPGRIGGTSATGAVLPDSRPEVSVTAGRYPGRRGR